MQRIDDAEIEARWEKQGLRWNTPLMKEIRQAERDRLRLYQPKIDAATSQYERDDIRRVWGNHSDAENDVIGQRHGLPPMLRRDPNYKPAN